MPDAEAAVRRLLDDHPAAGETPPLRLLDFDVVLRVPDAALGAYLTDLYAPLQATGNAAHVLTLAAAGSGWSVHLDETRLLLTPARSVALRTLLWEANRQAIERTREPVLVHASAVARGGRAIVLPGPMGAGKSTVAAALVRAGLGYVTDEVVAIDAGTGRIRPYPKYLSLGAQLAELVPGPPPGVREYLGDQVLVAPDALRAGAWDPTAGPPAPALVVVPRYEPGASAALEPLDRATTLATLAQHAFHLSADCQRTLDVLDALVERAPGYSLVSGDIEGATEVLMALLDDASTMVTP